MSGPRGTIQIISGGRIWHISEMCNVATLLPFFGVCFALFFIFCGGHPAVFKGTLHSAITSLTEVGSRKPYEMAGIESDSAAQGTR